ncbi:Golgi membrane protein 1-like isoform X2 [Mytilus californianus]|uniref:Golgi membrane protein 1-like isoform X2 n=1 Tax=Mytilus californianus TaxID=6549 RepID=UPI0022468396|nr:Golgi membrane protein 1-like isoform X2 [Mytilus californianus]
MSGNGRGAARNPSKSPPFLIIGLLVALAILGFNYWNLSSSNGSLSATNMDLQDQIRILTSKRLNEEQSKRDIERKYQLIEQRIATKDSEIKKLQEDVDKKGGDVERAENSKKECETNLQQCETNNSGIQSQLSAVKDEVDKLKSQPAAASTQNCDSQCREQVKKLYSEMFQKVGAAPMQQLINSGIDIGEDLKIQVQQAAGAGGQKQIQPPNAGEQPGQQQQPAQEQPAQQQTAKELEAEKGKDNLLQPNTKVNGTNQEKGQNKTEGENAQKSAGEANVKEMEQGSKKAGGEVKTTESSKTVQGQKDGVQNEKENVAKTVKDDDAGYDDEDDGKDTGDKVEANKNMKFSPKKTDDDSIDALRRNLNTQ